MSGPVDSDAIFREMTSGVMPGSLLPCGCAIMRPDYRVRLCDEHEHEMESVQRFCTECGRAVQDHEVAHLIPDGMGHERRLCADCFYDGSLKAASDARRWAGDPS